ncbi:hypothetical protein Cni_G16562 [Canna indica]|uniref:HTH myb-type domain-containing protein n=1 Tax=Canna indica TaxID=4628 RepID=A0AAQ3QFZ7_9LILI|nr:hypothetical protein Cni_G16562 [Canna indica]
MGPAVAEMGLELKLCAMRTVGGFLKEASATESGDSGRAARLEESIRSLEEEKRKIEAFKRELPLCMHLLCDVIEGLNKEIDRCRGEKSGRVFEEFIPIKSIVAGGGGVKAETDCEDKMNWMSSVQLWSDTYCENDDDDVKNHDKMNSQEERGSGDHGGQGKENLFLECKSRNRRGAFVPFKGPPAFAASCKEEEKPELSMQSPAIKKSTLSLVQSVAEDHRVGGGFDASKAVSRVPESSRATAGTHLSLQQTSRKARRCWSQELHRQFVLAIQQLGGAQVATPKQIREHMMVEGLTNDEVKSHLQKYRIHTRRASSNASATTVGSAGVAGDFWNPNEQYTSPSQQSFSQSGSPQSPLQLAGSTHAVSVSLTAGDSSEEDAKSESYSWK